MTGSPEADFVGSDISHPSVAGGESSGYKIQPGDVVLIDVWRVPVLSQKVRVGLDGGFLYPLIGTVLAEGRTVDELRTYLTEALGENYLVDPVITVTLDAGTQTFFVAGEVKHPGAFKLEEKIDVYQAIITAGGFTDFASNQVRILRKTGEEQKVIKININEFKKQAQTNPEAEIQPGDTVVVSKSLI